MTDETPIQNALTPEEWADWLTHYGSRPNSYSIRFHASAALRLYGQPFGFTHKDLQDLDSVIHADNQGWQGQLDSLRERIAALLPPAQP